MVLFYTITPLSPTQHTHTHTSLSAPTQAHHIPFRQPQIIFNTWPSGIASIHLGKAKGFMVDIKYLNFKTYHPCGK